MYEFEATIRTLWQTVRGVHNFDLTSLYSL